MNQITDSRDKRDQKADEHTNTNLHFQSISLKKKNAETFQPTSQKQVKQDKPKKYQFPGLYWA